MRWLLLYTDRDEPVTRAFLGAPRERDVVALSIDQLLDEVALDDAGWRWRGVAIDPARTAVVNRLVVPPARDAHHALASAFHEHRLWTWLHRELERFAYASSSPSPTSLVGCFGSLVDQWLDLPTLAEHLVVPRFRAPWSREPLAGDVHRVDPWHLYSLGARGDDGPPDARVAYARPAGHLMHVAQVGGMLLVANAPPSITRAQQAAIVAFADAMAARSRARILEHAFFVGDGPPVLYSTCPVPVITGAVPEYRDFLFAGLDDDLRNVTARAARVDAPARAAG